MPRSKQDASPRAGPDLRALPRRLSGWAGAQGVRLPARSADRVVNDHLFHLVFPTEPARAPPSTELRARGIMASSTTSLHSSPFGRTLPGTRGEFPVTERVAARLLRLPMHPLLEDADVERVIEAVTGRPA